MVLWTTNLQRMHVRAFFCEDCGHLDDDHPEPNSTGCLRRTGALSTRRRAGVQPNRQVGSCPAIGSIAVTLPRNPQVHVYSPSPPVPLTKGEGRLIVLRQLFQFGQCEYRPFFADVNRPAVAAAAFAYPALHAIFQAGVDVPVSQAHFAQDGQT
jgi:hypothetical protein